MVRVVRAGFLAKLYFSLFNFRPWLSLYLVAAVDGDKDDIAHPVMRITFLI